MCWRLGVVGVGLWVMACGSLSASEEQTPVAETRRRSAGEAELPTVASVASPLEAVAARYRLAPDRRALLAGADVVRLLGGDGAALTATWNGTGWTLQRGATEAGRLPELPSYEDLTAWLDDVASAQGGTTPRAGGAMPSRPAASSPPSSLLSVSEAFALARSSGSEVATDAATAFGSGAHALSALALQLPDAFGTNAGLAARALALVTLARAAGTLAPADEVLVAAALGYRGAAAKLAEALPVNDPVRAFALRDDARLSEMTSAGARRLRLLRYVELGDSLGARSWVKTHLGAEALELHALAARLELGAFDDMARSERTVPGLLILHARRELGEPGSLAHRELSGRDAEEAVATLGDDDRPWATLHDAIAALPTPVALGPLLAGPPGDEDLLRASYRSLAHGAIDALATWAVARKSSSLADAVEESLKGSGTFTDDVRWVRLYRGAKARSLPMGTLVSRLEKLPFADRAARRVLEAAIDRAERGQFDVLPLARTAVRRLDTRIAHRALWSRVSTELLADPVRAEALARSALAEDLNGPLSLRLQLARWDGELSVLRAVLDDAYASVADKVDVLETLLHERELGPRELPERITSLGPLRRWDVVSPAVRLLEDSGDPAGARRLAQEFLAAGELEGLAPVFARTAIARTFQAEKRLPEAWQAIEPAIESSHGSALERGALIQQALGHDAEALQLAQRNVERYPTSAEALGVLAELHWRSRRNEAAAAVLAAQQLTEEECRWTIGPHLASAAADGIDVRAIARSLSHAEVSPSRVLSLLQVLETSPKHQATLVDIYRSLPLGGLLQLDMLSNAARMLHRTQGPAAATAFLKTEIPPEQLPAFGRLAFSRRLDDALWSVVPLEVPGADVDANLWLFRAAASLRAGWSSSHRDALLAHFRADKPSHYHALGRHLLGLTDEASAIALGTDRKRSVEVAYYLGLKADIERRLPEAVGWYRVAIESGMPQAYETHLAFRRLAAWRSSGKSLARLAAIPAAEDTPSL